MKYFVITDSSDTLVGLRLAGIEGVLIGKGELANEAIQKATQDPDIGILLITERLAAQCSELLVPLKSTAHRPLVVEIPDRYSLGRTHDSIMRHIKEAIGVKI